MTSTANQIPRDQIRRILIIKWSALGDIAIASAIMEDIAASFPNAEIHLNTLPGNLRLFKYDPRFKEVFAIDVRKKGERWSNNLAWISKVRSGRYDLLIDLQRSDHSRGLLVLLWLSGNAAKYRLGNLGGFPYTYQPTIRDPRARAMDMMRSALEPLAIPAQATHPVFYASDSQLERVNSIRKRYGLDDGTYVVMLPGSQPAGFLKRWGTDNYVKLARLLHASGMEKVVLISGPDELDVCEEIAKTGDFVANLTDVDLLEIGPLCAGAAAIIGNDTGNLHFAAGSNRPVLEICGPTDPRRVKPIGDSVYAIQATLPCINCYLKFCNNPDDHACMKAITPEWIAEQVPALATGSFKAGQLFLNGLRSF
ncbi:MAG: glycosyltransferase family 9 protein [Thiobacillaceae bacterium]|jgi:heptosyltransferase-2